MRQKIYLICLFFSYWLGGCTIFDSFDSNRTNVPSKAWGYKPVYTTREEAYKIISLPPQDIENAGKIFTKGKYIYLVEQNKGFHIIDNSDPQNPVNIAFVKIYNCVDIVAKGDVFYVNSGSDLVTLDLSNPLDVKVLNRSTNVFPYTFTDPIPPAYQVRLKPNNIPEYETGYYECVDESKGLLTGWVADSISYPKCYTQY